MAEKGPPQNTAGAPFVIKMIYSKKLLQNPTNTM